MGHQNKYYRNPYLERAKAERAEKTNLIVFGAVILLVIALYFMWLTFRGGFYNVDALTADYDVEYVTYTVEVGDTLSYIAEIHIGEYPGSFSEYMDLIASENGITNPSFIREGQKIVVPVYTEINN